MGAFEIAVVFIMSWWLVLLPILSMGQRSQAEAGEIVPGSEPGAPESVPFLRKAAIATAGATLITFLVWLALRMGWLELLAPGP
jgi:predicted secreted protein